VSAKAIVGNNPTGKKGPRGWNSGAVLGFLAVTVVGLVAMPLIPAGVGDEGMLQVVIAVALFALGLCAILAASAVRKTEFRVTVYHLALFLWWVSLVAEVYFGRVSTSYNIGSGQFSILAYGEGMTWVLSLLVLGLISLRQPHYLKDLFSSSSKWVVFFAGLCILSIAWAPGKGYAAVWSVKLVLVILLLQLCSTLMRTVEDVTLFFKVTAAGFFFLTVVPLIQAFFDPLGVFDPEEHRLSGNPDLLAPTAASFMMLGIILHAVTKKRYWTYLSFVGAVIMLLSFGKAGIVGGIAGTALFVMLEKGAIKSLGRVLLISALGLFLIEVTPVGSYLEGYSGGSSLTGRTVIWTKAIQAISAKPIFGYGYLGTYYSWENTSGLHAGTVHLHNGFIEVAYNNGLVGEFLLLALHFVILRNIFLSLGISRRLREQRPGSSEAWHAYLFTAGLLGFYVHAFIQGIFGADFGGRCKSPYALFLAVFVMADVVRRINDNMLQTALANRENWRHEPTFRALDFSPVQQ